MDSTSIEATRRQTRGRAAARRVRAAGLVPGVLYGHGREAVPLAVPRPALAHLLERGAHMVTLNLEGTEEQAIVREVQHDALGTDIIHVDFARVARDELVGVEVPIELHGTARGALAGGALGQPLHRLTVRCRAGSIPESIRADVADLEIGQSIHVRDLQLPPGVTPQVPGDTVVAIVHPPRAEQEVAVPPEAAAAEPEVIRAKPAEEAEAEKPAEG